MAARARAQPRSAFRSDGSQRWAAQAPAPTATAWVAAASHRIESPNVPWMSSAANASPAPTPATAGQTRRSLPTRSSSHVATRNPAGAYSNTSKSGTSPGRSGTERSSIVSSSVSGPPSTPGSRSDRNNGVTASHSVARAYAPARRNVGTPRRKCLSLARTTAVTSSAMMRAPPQAPSVLVVTSTMLAVRTGETTCSPSTVALSASATSVARQISARTRPEGELTTHTTPSPPNSAALRRPSIASRQPREGVNARASRWRAAARSGEKWSSVTVAMSTTATYATRAATNRVRGVNTSTNTRRRRARVKPWRTVARALTFSGPDDHIRARPQQAPPRPRYPARGAARVPPQPHPRRRGRRADYGGCARGAARLGCTGPDGGGHPARRRCGDRGRGRSHGRHGERLRRRAHPRVGVLQGPGPARLSRRERGVGREERRRDRAPRQRGLRGAGHAGPGGRGECPGAADRGTGGA